MGEGEFLLEMLGITKEFSGVRVLDNVDFRLRPGEVHALLGENGAGKSTLMKILAGALQKDNGEILLNGVHVDIQNPLQAQLRGISIVHQEFNLVPSLSIAENIYLGREPRVGKLYAVDWKKMLGDARAILKQLDCDIDLDVACPVKYLSVAEKQMVEIAKAISLNARIIAMDEPSATLTDHELERLFSLILSLKSKGMGIIYISHRLEEIFQIADRVTVLKDGEVVGTRDINEIDKTSLVQMMVGRPVKEFPNRNDRFGEEVLRVVNLGRRGAVENASFSVRAGEILGIAGLVGSGRTELVRLIFGADPKDSGDIYLNGVKVNIRCPRDAVALGIGFLPEDRKDQGLVLGLSVRENITLAGLRDLCHRGFIRALHERGKVEEMIGKLRIKTSSPDQVVHSLSGGNQQKVVLAKWLITKSKVIIFDEPTRGVDVGAKEEIYRLISALAKQGIGIIVVSSELPEILGLCDRILVMCEGRISGELSRDEASEGKIMLYATGMGGVA